MAGSYVSVEIAAIIHLSLSLPQHIPACPDSKKTPHSEGNPVQHDVTRWYTANSFHSPALFVPKIHFADLKHWKLFSFLRELHISRSVFHPSAFLVSDLWSFHSGNKHFAYPKGFACWLRQKHFVDEEIIQRAGLEFHISHKWHVIWCDLYILFWLCWLMQRSRVLCSAAQFVSVLARPEETCLVSKRRKRSSSSIMKQTRIITAFIFIFIMTPSQMAAGKGVVRCLAMTLQRIISRICSPPPPICFTRLYSGLPFIVYSSGPNFNVLEEEESFAGCCVTIIGMAS